MPHFLLSPHHQRLLRAFTTPQQDREAQYALDVLLRSAPVQNVLDLTHQRFGDILLRFSAHDISAAYEQAKVALKNDVFRLCGPLPDRGINGDIHLTEPVLFSPQLSEIWTAVQNCDHFPVHLNPLERREAADVFVHGQWYRFRISYWNADRTMAVDPVREACFRVLTVDEVR